MRWVNDTLPPRPRRRWLLMTTRLSISSLAGMARTLVAVGTARLASMLLTTRAAAPRSGWRGVAVSAAGVWVAGGWAAGGGGGGGRGGGGWGGLGGGGAFPAGAFTGAGGGGVAGLRSGWGLASAGAGRAGASAVVAAPFGAAS